MAADLFPLQTMIGVAVGGRIIWKNNSPPLISASKRNPVRQSYFWLEANCLCDSTDGINRRDS